MRGLKRKVYNYIEIKKPRHKQTNKYSEEEKAVENVVEIMEVDTICMANSSSRKMAGVLEALVLS